MRTQETKWPPSSLVTMWSWLRSTCTPNLAKATCSLHVHACQLIHIHTCSYSLADKSCHNQPREAQFLVTTNHKVRETVTGGVNTKLILLTIIVC